MIKIAQRNMQVGGSVTEWRQWTGIDFAAHVSQLQGTDDRVGSNLDLTHTEITFPAGLVLLRLYINTNRCVYIEPNIWIYHDLYSQ